MGATAQQDFAINFLTALNNIWSEHSGTFQVAETEELLPALAQISIRWLAATAREQLPADPRNLQVRGDVRYDVAGIEPNDAFRHRRTISLRDALNHIVHAEPEWVSVQGREVILCWRYTPQYGADPTKYRPYCAYFLADSLIAAVRRALYSEQRRLHQVQELEQMMRTDTIYACLLSRTAE